MMWQIYSSSRNFSSYEISGFQHSRTQLKLKGRLVSWLVTLSVCKMVERSDLYPERTHCRGEPIKAVEKRRKTIKMLCARVCVCESRLWGSLRHLCSFISNSNPSVIPHTHSNEILDSSVSSIHTWFIDGGRSIFANTHARCNHSTSHTHTPYEYTTLCNPNYVPGRQTHTQKW